MDAFVKEYLAESVSVLNAVQWWCLKKMFNGEIILICHLKMRLKRLCYYKWKAWYKLLSSSGLKKNLCTFLSCTIHPFRGARTNWKFIICFANTLGSFQLHDLVNDFWKKYYSIFFSSSWWCTPIYQQTRHTKKCLLEFPILLALN